MEIRKNKRLSLNSSEYKQFIMQYICYLPTLQDPNEKLPRHAFGKGILPCQCIWNETRRTYQKGTYRPPLSMQNHLFLISLFRKKKSSFYQKHIVANNKKKVVTKPYSFPPQYLAPGYPSLYLLVMTDPTACITDTDVKFSDGMSSRP